MESSDWMGALLYQTRKRTIALIVSFRESLKFFPSVASFPTLTSLCALVLGYAAQVSFPPYFVFF